MVKRFLVALLFSCVGMYTHAQNAGIDTLRCPIDSELVLFYPTIYDTITGHLLDFEETGFINNHYEYLVSGCKRCHFCGYREDFDTTYTGATKQALIDLLKPYKKEQMQGAVKYEIAAKIYEYFHEENDHIGWLYLTGSYLLRNEPAPAKRRKAFQRNAITWLEKSLAANELKQEEKIPGIYFLVGELYRRTAQFDKAIEYYDRAINAPKKESWVETYAQKQKAMAKKKNADNSI